MISSGFSSTMQASQRSPSIAGTSGDVDGAVAGAVSSRRLLPARHARTPARSRRRSRARWRSRRSHARWRRSGSDRRQLPWPCWRIVGRPAWWPSLRRPWPTPPRPPRCLWRACLRRGWPPCRLRLGRSILGVGFGRLLPLAEPALLIEFAALRNPLAWSLCRISLWPAGRLPRSSRCTASASACPRGAGRACACFAACAVLATVWLANFSASWVAVVP